MTVLYSEKLLDHFRHPHNYGALTDPDISYESFNPLCGDRIRIDVKLEAGSVKEARFRGDGCAISIAAASLLTELLTGRKLDEPVADEELIATLESAIQPSRIQCALLPLEALRAGIKVLHLDRQSPI